MWWKILNLCPIWHRSFSLQFQVATSRIVERFNEYLMNLVKMTSDYLTNIVDVLITLVLACSLSPLFERRRLAFMSGTLLFTSPTCLQIIWWSINTIKLILNPSKYPSYFLSTRVTRAQGFYVYTKKISRTDQDDGVSSLLF